VSSSCFCLNIFIPVPSVHCLVSITRYHDVLFFILSHSARFQIRTRFSVINDSWGVCLDSVIGKCNGECLGEFAAVSYLTVPIRADGKRNECTKISGDYLLVSPVFLCLSVRSFDSLCPYVCGNCKLTQNFIRLFQSVFSPAPFFQVSLKNIPLQILFRVLLIREPELAVSHHGPMDQVDRKYGKMILTKTFEKLLCVIHFGIG
jgi:hypothetical protein